MLYGLRANQSNRRLLKNQTINVSLRAERRILKDKQTLDMQIDQIAQMKEQLDQLEFHMNNPNLF
jgi:hypothetical protein